MAEVRTAAAAPRILRHSAPVQRRMELTGGRILGWPGFPQTTKVPPARSRAVAFSNLSCFSLQPIKASTPVDAHHVYRRSYRTLGLTSYLLAPFAPACKVLAVRVPCLLGLKLNASNRSSRAGLFV